MFCYCWPEGHVEVAKGHDDGPGDDGGGQLTVAEVVESVLGEDLVHIGRDDQVPVPQVTRGLCPPPDGGHSCACALVTWSLRPGVTCLGLQILIKPNIPGSVSRVWRIKHDMLHFIFVYKIKSFCISNVVPHQRFTTLQFKISFVTIVDIQWY